MRRSWSEHACHGAGAERGLLGPVLHVSMCDVLFNETSGSEVLHQHTRLHRNARVKSVQNIDGEV